MIVKDKIKVFEKELSLIKDSSLKKFLKEILKYADDRFFIEPASSSGKYHPDFAGGAGGLVLHTKAVVYFLKEMLRTELFDIDEHHQELLYIAAICHDIKKYGEDGKSAHTDKNHPENAAKYIQEINKKEKVLSKEDLSYIQSAIISHMGIWGNTKPQTDSEKLLHIADILASRKEIELKFSEEEKKQVLPNINEYRVDFGMHAGKLLTEVPIDYLEWADKNIDKKPVFKSLVKEYLKEKKK